MAFQYLKGIYKKDGDRLFSKVCYNNNVFKLKEGGFGLDIRKILRAYCKGIGLDDLYRSHPMRICNSMIFCILP